MNVMETEEINSLILISIKGNIYFFILKFNSWSILRGSKI